MWLDRVHSFVKAGKVFNHNVFLTLYHSCYTQHKCEYLHQWSLHLLLFSYAPYIFLIFTHLAHCPWDSSLSTDEDVSISMNCKQTQLVLFVEALTHAHSSVHRRAPWVTMDLAVLAPISKIKFCTTLLRLQLPGRANFCCLYSQWAMC